MPTLIAGIMVSALHYKAERPCRRCGNSYRYKSTRACVVCVKRATYAKRGVKIESPEPTIDDLIGEIPNA